MRRPTYESSRERYQRDAAFHQMVNSLLSLLEEAELTEGDLHEAVLMARCIHIERHPAHLEFGYLEWRHTPRT